MFNSYQPNYFPGLYNPQPQMPQVATAYAPRMEVTRVSGRPGAEAFNMGPNSSALLLDESGTIVWLVTTDGAGYKKAEPYDIAPHKAAEAPDFGSLEARVSRLEEAFKNGNSGNPASPEQKRNKPAADAN